MHIYIYAHTQIYVYICIHIRACIPVYIQHGDKQGHIDACVHTCIRAHARMHERTHTTKYHKHCSWRTGFAITIEILLNTRDILRVLAGLKRCVSGCANVYFWFLLHVLQLYITLLKQFYHVLRLWCDYGMATISRLLKIIGLFCRRQSLLLGSFAKETYYFKEPTNRSHPILPMYCH